MKFQIVLLLFASLATSAIASVLDQPTAYNYSEWQCDKCGGQEQYAKAMELFRKSSGAHQYDCKSSIPLFIDAANLGHLEAMHKLEFCYDYRKSPQQNEALPWLEKAASTGYAEAECLLGDFLVRNNEVDKGLDWMRKSAADGYSYAYFLLALHQTDAQKRWDLYQRAAEENVPEAMFAIGNVYKCGYLGTKIDVTEAKRWFKKVALMHGATPVIREIPVFGDPNMDANEFAAVMQCMLAPPWTPRKENIPSSADHAKYSIDKKACDGQSQQTIYGSRLDITDASTRICNMVNDTHQGYLSVIFGNGWGGVRRDLGGAVYYSCNYIMNPNPDYIWYTFINSMIETQKIENELNTVALSASARSALKKLFEDAENYLWDRVHATQKCKPEQEWQYLSMEVMDLRKDLTLQLKDFCKQMNIPIVSEEKIRDADKQLNTAYKKFLTSDWNLEDPEHIAIRTMERSWIVYRDSWIAFAKETLRGRFDPKTIERGIMWTTTNQQIKYLHEELDRIHALEEQQKDRDKQAEEDRKYEAQHSIGQ